MEFTTEQINEEIKIIGIRIKTTNENNQAGTDIYGVWDRIFKEGIIDKIPNKESNDMYAVYFDYEGDYTQPYSYIAGCKVNSLEDKPEGMESVVITTGKFAHIIAKGKMPDCIMNAWQEIWKSDLDRAYKADFEVYGPKSQESENAEVDIFLSVK